MKGREDWGGGRREGERRERGIIRLAFLPSFSTKTVSSRSFLTSLVVFLFSAPFSFAALAPFPMMRRTLFALAALLVGAVGITLAGKRFLVFFLKAERGRVSFFPLSFVPETVTQKRLTPEYIRKKKLSQRPTSPRPLPSTPPRPPRRHHRRKRSSSVSLPAAGFSKPSPEREPAPASTRGEAPEASTPSRSSSAPTRGSPSRSLPRRRWSRWARPGPPRRRCSSLPRPSPSLPPRRFLPRRRRRRRRRSRRRKRQPPPRPPLRRLRRRRGRPRLPLPPLRSSFSPCAAA